VVYLLFIPEEKFKEQRKMEEVKRGCFPPLQFKSASFTTVAQSNHPVIRFTPSLIQYSVRLPLCKINNER